VTHIVNPQNAIVKTVFLRIINSGMKSGIRSWPLASALSGRKRASPAPGVQSQGKQGSPESIDELIIRKRRERELQVDKKTEW